MSANKNKTPDYKTLSFGSKENGVNGRSSFKPLKSPKKEEFEQSLKNFNPKYETSEAAEARRFVVSESVMATGETDPSIENFNQISDSYAEQERPNKKQKKIEKDERLLSSDRWLTRNGHTLTYAGIFLFTLILYFRPTNGFPVFRVLAQWLFGLLLRRF
jgi:hypothetical protein